MEKIIILFMYIIDQMVSKGLQKVNGFDYVMVEVSSGKYKKVMLNQIDWDKYRLMPVYRFNNMSKPVKCRAIEKGSREEKFYEIFPKIIFVIMLFMFLVFIFK